MKYNERVKIKLIKYLQYQNNTKKILFKKNT